MWMIFANYEIINMYETSLWKNKKKINKIKLKNQSWVSLIALCLSGRLYDFSPISSYENFQKYRKWKNL